MKINRGFFVLAGFVVLLAVAVGTANAQFPWSGGKPRTLRFIPLMESDSDTSAVAGDIKVRLAIPAEMNGCRLINVIGRTDTKGVTGTTDISPIRVRAGVIAKMLSTDVTIGDEYYATDGVINATYAEVATGDAIGLTVTAIHSGTAPKGLACTVTFDCPR